MNQRRLVRLRRLPERVEVGIVQIAAEPFWLGADHGAVKARAHRLVKNLRGELAVLHRHRAQRRQRWLRLHRIEHMLVH